MPPEVCANTRPRWVILPQSGGDERNQAMADGILAGRPSPDGLLPQPAQAECRQERSLSGLVKQGPIFPEQAAADREGRESGSTTLFCAPILCPSLNRESTFLANEWLLAHICTTEAAKEHIVNSRIQAPMVLGGRRRSVRRREASGDEV